MTPSRLTSLVITLSPPSPAVPVRRASLNVTEGCRGPSSGRGDTSEPGQFRAAVHLTPGG